MPTDSVLIKKGRVDAIKEVPYRMRERGGGREREGGERERERERNNNDTSYYLFTKLQPSDGGHVK